MSIQTEGYLSADIHNWTKQHRAVHGPWFDLLDRLNRLVQRVMLETVVPADDNQSMMMLLLFARSVSSFQGASLLVERGMTIEARTLARSTLESAFYLGAISNDASFIDQLLSARMKHNKTTANWLTGNGAPVAKLSDEQVKNLGQFLDDLKTSGAATDAIRMQQAAQKAKMADIYEVLYRDLSNGAAHPSLDSLRRHIEEDDACNLIGLRSGPDAKDIRETIIDMTMAMFCAVKGLNTFLNTECKSELTACWGLHTQLIDTQHASTISENANVL